MRPAGRDIAERAAPVADQPGDRPRRHERDDEGDEAQHQRQEIEELSDETAPRQSDGEGEAEPLLAAAGSGAGLTPPQRRSERAQEALRALGVWS